METTQKIILSILFLNCTLIGVAFGLIGESVKLVRGHDYDFVVSIGKKSPNDNSSDTLPQHFCTGSLVTQKSIVTAGHCLLYFPANQVQIVAGSSNLRKGKKYDVESWITYDQWNNNQPTLYPLNDIGVIVLKGEGVMHSDFHPVPALTIDNEHLDDKDIRMCGWGSDENGKTPISMRTAHLKVVSNEECSNHGTMLKGKKFTVPPNYFCSKSLPWVISSCGDGGAPILNRKHRLVGINIGACPKVDGYPQEMLNQLLMNSHLHIQYYSDFLLKVLI